MRGEKFPVYLNIVLEHLKPVFQVIVRNLTALDVNFFQERDAVRHHPCVALAGDGAELVVHSKSLFMGSDDGREQFAGKLLPEIVEEILQRAADAAVVVGRAQYNDIRRNDFLF